MSYKLIWEHSGVYRLYFGDVSIAERRKSFNEICDDWRFGDIRYVISDYLAVEKLEVTKHATEEIAALHIGALITNPRISIAAVVTRPDIVNAIQESIDHGLITAPYRIFGSIEEARLWINNSKPNLALHRPGTRPR